jgi:histidine ammonia-lyase
VTVLLRLPQDLDLAAFRRVAWEGEDVALHPAALERIARRREAFEAFAAAHAEERLYGITTVHHRGAGTLLAPQARAAYARRIPPTAASFGPALPARIVRGTVAARLAGFVAGGAAVRPVLAEAVAGMLRRPLPAVPLRGHGDPGEIIALRAVFGGLEDELELAAKEGMALVNGAPCAAAALADGALAGHGRLAVADAVLALSLEAALAPPAHLDAALDAVWGDPYEAAALASLRGLLDGGHAERRAHQAAVAFRDTPRLLGWLRRAQAQAEECAAISLAAPGDNPTFVPDDHAASALAVPGPERADAGRSSARVLANAGYHDPRAAPTLHALAAAWADVAGLAAVQAVRLADDPAGLAASEAEPGVTLLCMTAVGWAEEARVAAQPTPLSLGGSAPSDTSSPALLAWRLAEDAGTCLQAVLTVLGVLAAHTIAAAGRPVPPALAARAGDVLAAFPPAAHRRSYGEGLERVAAGVEREVHPHR